MTKKTRAGSFISKGTVIVALCILLAVFTWIMDRASIKVQLFAYGWDYGFFVNAIPVILVFLLLLAVFNRTFLALIVTLSLTVALYAANYLKLKYLDVPVSFSDIYLLENIHASTLDLLVNFTKVGYLIAGVVVVAAVVAGSIWRERAFFRRRSMVRAIVAAVVLFCMISLGMGARWMGDVYDGGRLRVIAWAPMLTILHSGLISSIAYTSVERSRALNVPVNQKDINHFLRMNTGTPLRAHPAYDERPDVVMVQSESFFNPAILKNVDNTDDLLPTLHRALTNGIGGTMKAPTFGGGTLRTEFEVLTGIPMAAYPDIEFPYLQITQQRIPSLIHLAHDDGYATVAIHGNSGTFWNRDKAFNAIGFDRFITAAQFPQHAAHDGWYFADSAMTDQIIGQLKTAKKPTLIFAISIEAHGPYLHSPVDDKVRRDAVPAPPGLVGKPLQAYRNYMYHIEDADQQMGRLWNFLAARKRPYILVFYGDHLPPLQRVYKATGFDNDNSGPEQSVPWFIVGSAIQHRQQHVKAWMMGSEVRRAAGLGQTPYYRLIAKAERGLSHGTNHTHREAILQGVYSLSRLYLKGKLDADLKQPKQNGESSVANMSKH